MSSTTTDLLSAELRLSHSTPQKPSPNESMMRRSQSCDISSTGDSTYSLLSPIYHDSFDSDIEDHSFHEEILAGKTDTKKPCNPNQGGASAIERSLADLKLSPWETWLLSKERQGRLELQNKIIEELKQEEERRRQELKKEQKKQLAEEQHREWVRKKQEQERKEKEQLLLQEKQEKELEEQKKRLIEEKSKERYQEWLNKKRELEQERKRRQKEEEEKRLAEQREKKEKAKRTFEEWVEQAKNRPRPTLNSYGYVNGKLTACAEEERTDGKFTWFLSCCVFAGYYNGSSYPAPGFYNPIPWKPIPAPPPPKENAKNTSGKKKRRPVSHELYRPGTAIVCKPKDNLQVGGGMFRR